MALARFVEVRERDELKTQTSRSWTCCCVYHRLVDGEVKECEGFEAREKKEEPGDEGEEEDDEGDRRERKRTRRTMRA